MVTEYNRYVITQRRLAEAERKPAEPAPIEVKPAEPAQEISEENEGKTELAEKKTDAEKIRRGRKKAE